MSAARRRDCSAAARRHDLVILEDDPYGSIYFEDMHDRSKTRGPSRPTTRMGGSCIWAASRRCSCRASASRGWWRRRRSRRRSSSPSRPPTSAAASSISASSTARSIAAWSSASRPTLRAHYQAQAHGDGAVRCRRRSAGRVTWTTPRGGFFLWIELPPGIDDLALFDRALKHKVSFVIGSAFFVDGGGHQFARLVVLGHHARTDRRRRRPACRAGDRRVRPQRD